MAKQSTKRGETLPFRQDQPINVPTELKFDEQAAAARNRLGDDHATIARLSGGPEQFDGSREQSCAVGIV